MQENTFVHKFISTQTIFTIKLKLFIHFINITFVWKKRNNIQELVKNNLTGDFSWTGDINQQNLAYKQLSVT